MSIETLFLRPLLPVWHQQILVNALRAKKEGVVLFSIVINALRAIASVDINIQWIIGIIDINALWAKKKNRLF